MMDSRADQVSDLQSMLDAKYDLLSRCLVVSPGLLTKLKSSDYMRNKVPQIRQQTTADSKVTELLDILGEVPDSEQQSVFRTLLSALRQDGQEHVANIFCPESDVRPMSDEHFELLVQVCQCIDPLNCLVDELVAQKVFSHKERCNIMASTAYDDKSLEIINIILRKPDSAFDKFVSALAATKQEHVASLLGHQTTNIPMTGEHRQMLISKKEELSHYINPSCRLLSGLESVGVFSKREIDIVASISGDIEKSIELVNILLRKSDSSFDKFIEALNNTEQQHVVHILTGQGESPLSRVRRLVLRKARDRIVSRVDTMCTSLLPKLISSGVLTVDDKQRIEAHNVNEHRTAVLIDVMARKSDDAYDKFLQGLKDSGHSTVAVELEGLEVRGTVDPQFFSDTSPAEKIRIVEIVRNNMKALLSGNGHEFNEITNFMEQHGFVISEISDGSIHISFRCFGEASVENLKRWYSDKTLDKLLTKLFCPPFADQGLESLTLYIADHEFEQSTETLRQMDDLSQIRVTCRVFNYLPVELLELLLLRSLLKMFTVLDKSHCNTRLAIVQRSYSSLATVCYNWWQTMNGWPQSTTKHWFKNKLRHTIKSKLCLILASTSFDVGKDIVGPRVTDVVTMASASPELKSQAADLEPGKMASASRDLKSRVTDVVTCPICLGLMNNPKSLHCMHTFCLKCIAGFCRDNEPGEEVACPVCRQKFNIPATGVKGLVSNLFVADLVVEVRKTGSDVVVLVPCEVCSHDSDRGGSSVAVSTMYCVDCNQKLCERCSKPHRKWTGGPHKVMPIETDQEEAELIQLHSGKCDKHKTDDVRLYCFDCKTNICVVCFAKEHQQHKCKNVGTVAAECCKQIDADIEPIKERATGARNEISHLEEERRKFVAGVEEVSEKILKRGEELKQLIDRQVNELMAEVQVLKRKQCKEIDSHTDGIEMKLLAFENFSAYCSALMAKGKPCDITRASNDLHIRATELLQKYVTRTDYCSPVVTFKPTDIILELLSGGQNLVGIIKAKETKVVHVVHTLPEADPVVGLTSIGDELYILRNNVETQIEVYSITTTTPTLYSLQRHLSVPKLEGFGDMASCKHYRCLYISDYSSKCIHRVELNGNVTKLSVNYEPYSLSVTSQFTVLVTCREVSKLLELTTEGKQLREINLQSDIVHPWHAIKLPNGQFVVSHGNANDPIHRVCIVDTNGHVTQSYRGLRSSASVHLAVDKDGFIFVADTSNRRVLLMSPTLNFVREILSRDQLKWDPIRLFLDVDSRCLFVSDSWLIDEGSRTGRVVVVQL